MLGNQVATTNGRAVSTNVANPFLQASAGVSTFEGDYLKCNGNTGEYSYGKDGEVLALGTRVVLDMVNAEQGWICWKEGEVVERIMNPVMDFPVLQDVDTLPDHGPYKKNADGSEDGWSEMHTIPMADESGNKYLFQANSKGAANAVKRFYHEYGKKFVLNTDQFGAPQLPLVELDIASYVSKKNPKAGKKFTPVFKISEWVDRGNVADIFDNSGSAEDDTTAYETPAPAAAPVATRRVAAPAPAKATAAPARAAAAPARRPAPVETPAPEDDPAAYAEGEEAPPEEAAPAPAPARTRKPAGRPAPEGDEEPAATAPAPDSSRAKNQAAADNAGRRAKRF